MPKAKYVVYTRPSSPEREDEYNKWYDGTHIPEICSIPGFTGGHRFKVSATRPPGPFDPSVPEYMAIYDIESDDLQAVVDGLARAVADGRIHMSDALELDPPPKAILYEELDT